MVCFVAGCRSGHDGNKCHQFRFPRGGPDKLKNIWLKKIPKKPGKNWDFEKSLICSLHFEDKFVIKENVVCVNGVVIASEPRKRWVLTKDAVPTIFGNLNANRSPALKTQKSREKSPTKTISADHTSSGKSCLNVKQLQGILDDITLPSEEWITRESSSTGRPTIVVFVKSFKVFTTSSMQFEKKIEITKNMQMNYYVNGINVSSHFSAKCENVATLNEVLSKFEQSMVCKGFKIPPNVSSRINTSAQARLFSSECAGLTVDANICEFCRKTKSSLKLKNA